jgi:5,10-methylenetetrahydrofolate reductase
MKNYHILIISLCFLFSSCVTVTYFGDKLTPTTTVDIYYSAHDVTKQYKVIGHLTCNNLSQNAVKEKLTARAKSIGADAIIISGTEATKENQDAIVNADALKYTN